MHKTDRYANPQAKKAPMILGGFSQFTVSFHELVGTAAPADGSWDERSQLNSFEMCPQER